MEVSLRSRCQDNYEKSDAYFGGENYAQADESTARRLTIPSKIDTFSTILQSINPLASPKLAVSRYQFVLVVSIFSGLMCRRLSQLCSSLKEASQFWQNGSQNIPWS